MKVPEVITPRDMGHVATGAAAIMLEGLLVIDAAVQVSVVKNPLPENVTGVPTGPEIGVSVILGPVTTKVSLAKSPRIPVTVIVYVPGAALLMTLKLAEVITPLDMLHVGGGAAKIMLEGLLVIGVAAQALSAVLNPAPVTVTAVPAGPELGFSPITGAGVVTVKVA